MQISINVAGPKTRKGKGLLAACIVGAVALATGASSCSGGTSGGNAQEQKTSQQALTIYEQTQPAPLFDHSVIRDDITEVEAIQALGERSTTFFWELGNQDPSFECPSYGQPIPGGTQLTNPVQPVTYYDGNGVASTSVTIGNIDPNGIYPPAAAEGTNIICINAQGQPYNVYWEGHADAFSVGATYNKQTHMVQVSGATHMPTCRIDKTFAKHPVTRCTK